MTTEIQSDDFTSKELNYCLFYTAHATDTFHNARRAALKAGYSDKSVDQIAYALMRKDKIVRRIAELEAKTSPPPAPEGQPQDLDAVLARIFQEYQNATAAGDRSSAVRALDLLRQSLSDVPDQAEIQALSAREQALSRRVSLYLLTHDEASDMTTCPHCGLLIAGERTLTDQPALKEQENKGETPEADPLPPPKGGTVRS